jgi:hypothetical protein
MNDKALTLPQRAAVVLHSAECEERLKKLAVASVSILAITNSDAYKQCQAARMALLKERTGIEKDGKAAREDATAFNKAVLAEERRLIALIQPEESRLAALQETWDAAREREKQAKVNAELKRVADLQERVAELRGNPNLSASSGSALIAEHLKDLQSIVVDSTFQEYEQQALDAKDAGIKRLQDLHAAAVAFEAEQARVVAEREELARLRAEQAERQAAERVRIAEEERLAKAERDRLAAEQAATARAEAELLQAERAELARQAAEQRRIEAQKAAELAAERAAFEREQAAVRAREEAEERKRQEAARLAAMEKPSDAELIEVLAEHYSVPDAKVIEWLLAMDLSESQAA